MKNKTQKYYLYNKRYLKKSERKLRLHNCIKGAILEFITNNKKLCNRFDIWESFKLERYQWLDKHNLGRSEVPFEHNDFYSGIRLNAISFFEVVEIDDCSKFRKTVLSKFGNSRDFWGIDRKEELKEKLIDLENKFDNISWGRLFTVNYKKHKDKSKDLIDYIDCNYIKTNESYFIIRFDISISDKAKSLIKKIIEQKDVGLTFPNYNSYVKILTSKRFYYNESFRGGLKNYNINNLVKDINTQVKQNVTKYFKGYFHRSKILDVLPSIQLFEVDDIKKFKEDYDLQDIFTTSFGRYYSLQDEQIEIHFSDSWDNTQELIQIVKQKGHGDREKNKSDLTNYDKIEDHYLIRGLSFPCIFSAILREQTNKINTLKRQIYDQIKMSGNKFILRQFLLIGMNKKYLQLKHKSVQILLTIKRFENEFTDKKITLYTRDFPLDTFVLRDKRNNKERNLLQYYVKAFRFQINGIDKRTKSLNEVFKSLEEFNSYKTNYILQLFSIFIAILAFIFAFDKTKNFIIEIFKMINK